MRIFLSYSSDRRPLAEAIHHLLRSEGHRVFFDRDSLPPGETYGDRIRQAIAGCHLFVFLVSPGSLAEDSYALAELGMAQALGRRRPAVLPVLTAPDLVARLPPLLRPLTLLEPQGDAAATVAAQVDRIRTRRRRRRTWRAAAVGLLVLALAGGVQAAGGPARVGARALALLPGATTTPDAPEPGVRLRASPAAGGWLLNIDLDELFPREILYRFAGEDTFRSTGFHRYENPATGRPFPVTYTTEELRHDTVLFVVYVDSAGVRRGPFRLLFDRDAELVAHARDYLQRLPWLSFGSHEGRMYAHFSTVIVHKDALAEIRYGYDDEAPANTLRFTTETSSPGAARIHADDETFVVVPTGTGFVAVQLRYNDGTESEVRRFTVPWENG